MQNAATLPNNHLLHHESYAAPTAAASVHPRAGGVGRGLLGGQIRDGVSGPRLPRPVSGPSAAQLRAGLHYSTSSTTGTSRSRSGRSSLPAIAVLGGSLLLPVLPEVSHHQRGAPTGF
jgi:hypothetical protein